MLTLLCQTDPSSSILFFLLTIAPLPLSVSHCFMRYLISCLHAIQEYDKVRSKEDPEKSHCSALMACWGSSWENVTFLF